MHPITKLALDRRTLLWNALIPRRAVAVEVGRTHTSYLLPTKGWKHVANSRLGIPEA